MKTGSMLLKEKEKRLRQLNHRVNNDVSVVCYRCGMPTGEAYLGMLRGDENGVHVAKGEGEEASAAKS